MTLEFSDNDTPTVLLPEPVRPITLKTVNYIISSRCKLVFCTHIMIFSGPSASGSARFGLEVSPIFFAH
jgi:hypothetical protein